MDIVLAAEQENLEVVKRFSDNVNFQNEDGDTALMECAINGAMDIR